MLYPFKICPTISFLVCSKIQRSIKCGGQKKKVFLIRVSCLAEAIILILCCFLLINNLFEKMFGKTGPNRRKV